MNSRRTLSFEALERRELLFAGELDVSFGAGGKETLDFFGALNFAQAVDLQSDGSVLVAGSANHLEAFQLRTQLTLARFDQRGLLDAEFGVGGVAHLDLGDGSHTRASNVAVQADDKILVVGDTAPVPRLLVTRWTADGQLDDEFNESGVVLSDLSSGAQDVAVQPDHKIVVVGNAAGPLGFQLLLARLNENGSLDETFDEDGLRFTNLLTPGGSARAMALHNNQIVVAGFVTFDDPQQSAILVARFQANGGSLDSSFGDHGIVTTMITTDSKAADVAVQSDGKIVVVGSDAGRLVVARYTDTGGLDDDFANHGILLLEGLNPVVGGTTGGSLVIQPDGRILVTASGGNDFVLLRLNSNGSWDNSFNGVGKVVTDVQVTSDSSEAVALLKDGRIVVAGNSGGDWAVLRYIGGGLQWQRQPNRYDVDGDGQIVPFDIFRVVSELITPRWTIPGQLLPTTRPAAAPFYDVDGNNFLTSQDALQIINYLNRALQSEGELPTGELPTGAWDAGLAVVLDELADTWLGKRRSRPSTA